MQTLSKSQRLFHKNRKTHPEIHVESQGTPDSQSNLEEKEQTWRVYTSDFKTYYKGTVTSVEKKKDKSKPVKISEFIKVEHTKSTDNKNKQPNSVIGKGLE